MPMLLNATYKLYVSSLDSIGSLVRLTTGYCLLCYVFSFLAPMVFVHIIVYKYGKNIGGREHDSQLLVDMVRGIVYKYVMYHNIYNSNARQETIYFFKRR
jgi:hypothetical protein